MKHWSRVMGEPTDAQYKVGSLYYKIGIHGLAFVWLNGNWVRTTKTPAELKAKNKLLNRGE